MFDRFSPKTNLRIMGFGAAWLLVHPIIDFGNALPLDSRDTEVVIYSAISMVLSIMAILGISALERKLTRPEGESG